MPRDTTARRRDFVELTDAQIWQLVGADPSVSNHQLATELGAVVGTITHARRRQRQHGWTSPVSYTTCRYCGHALTRPGRHQGRRAYHPACRPVALQTLRQAPDRRRWEALPVEERRDSLARARAEDAVLIERYDAHAYVLARELRRTLYSVRHRRDRLRR
ncbi:MAG: hypothetical protein M3442_16440 [Chloroflexota bacterium]|nr:hypothetical protein [Chloroflexota bacterium]